MGSLSSRPAIPQQSQVIHTPAAASSTSSPAATSPAATNTTDASAVFSAAEARTQNLLSRERGRFGTILTGFRGLLGLSDKKSQRKTLLGE